MATVLLLGAGARFLLSARERLAVSAAALIPFTEPGFRLDGTSRVTPSFEFSGVIKALHPESRSFELETMRRSFRLPGIDQVIGQGNRLVYKMYPTADASVRRMAFTAREGTITSVSFGNVAPLSANFRELRLGDTVRVGGARTSSEGDGKFVVGLISIVDFASE